MGRKVFRVQSNSIRFKQIVAASLGISIVFQAGNSMGSLIVLVPNLVTILLGMDIAASEWDLAGDLRQDGTRLQHTK
jgi:1-aminocyclopropane-1-carboxylate deaminase/D-cysteine desulfhydrase-like pyridoxal-dependent ACC family enzyme